MATSKPRKNARSGKVFLGMLLLIAGCILLLDQLGFFFPNWLISLPTFLIALGLYIGYRKNFRNPASYILLIIGGLFLLDEIFPNGQFEHLVWPVLLIGLGMYIILGRNKGRWKDRKDDFEWDKRQIDDTGAIAAEPEENFRPNDQDFLDSVSIFGGVKKNIVSKNFRGGDIVNFMGGCEINMSQADINGRVVLEVTQVFGGTKIIVPAHWEVYPEMTAIFGGMEDKRISPADSSSSGKILVIRGTSIFGGIDIRSF